MQNQVFWIPGLGLNRDTIRPCCLLFTLKVVQVHVCQNGAEGGQGSKGRVCTVIAFLASYCWQQMHKGKDFLPGKCMYIASSLQHLRTQVASRSL